MRPRVLNETSKNYIIHGDDYCHNVHLRQEDRLMSALTLAQASAHIVKTNPMFAVSETDVRGVTYRTFKNVPPDIRSLLQLARNLHGEGKNDFVVYQNERWTFDQFTAESNRLTHAMSHRLGIRQGDHVGLAMRNYPELLMLMIAVSSIGAVAVPFNAWWTSQELQYGFEDSNVKTVFADGQRRQRILPFANTSGIQIIGVRDGETKGEISYSQLRDESTDTSWPDVGIDTDDDFAIMYSSGTTGHPKGVVQTHRGAISAIFTWLMTFVMAPLMADPADEPLPEPGPQANLIVTPLFHVTATHPIFLLGIAMGAKLVMLHKWDAREAVRVIDKEQITRFLGVPSQSAELMAAVRDMDARLPSLQYVGSGGAKRPAAQVAELTKAFPNSAIASGWGMTETNAVGLGIIGPDYSERPESTGRLLPPLQDLQILDDDGHPVANGIEGELCVKSPANMRCYLNKPEETAEVFKDGWLRTGDLAVQDDEGFVIIVDRKKDIIIRGGENISCLDVEGALHRHPAVAEAGVFSIPDERLGEAVGAGIQLKKGTQVDAAELTAFLKDHIAGFKIPTQYWFRESVLPRGATDKTDRRLLRAECLSS
jgi:long-chain acyl-CoA synthetase